MRYASNPKLAQMMLGMCRSGNNIYEVSYRCHDEAFGFCYSQGKTADEVEQRLMKSQSHIKVAVARRVREI